MDESMNGQMEASSKELVRNRTGGVRKSVRIQK